MIEVERKIDCCGCTACCSVCSRNAIKMEPDALGFLYPKVDQEKCIECGVCEKVCAFNENYETTLNLDAPVVYGARHKNIEEVMNSRSGAVFVAISDYILENGGVVYGVGYTEHFRVIHKRATTKLERDEFRGSKYVQSDVTGIFRQVKKDLKSGLMVLFSGTPCQVAGLRSFISHELSSNLFLLDIVCHGVPSPYIWKDYLEWQESLNDAKVVRVDFRDKKQFGWNKHYETLNFDNGRILSSYAYTYSFYTNLNLRQSCSQCHYTNLRRPSDITIADFWGWKNTEITINKDNKGLSLILCNTEKGLELYQRISERLKSYKVSIEQCLQPNLQHPTALHKDREVFELDYIQYGFEFVMHKYFQRGIDEIPRKPIGFWRKVFRKLKLV